MKEQLGPDGRYVQSLQMKIVDAQLHEPGVDRSWLLRDTEDRRAAMTEALKANLASVGVFGAILHPVEDREWAYALAEREPDRFVVVPMLDHGGPEGPNFGSAAIDPGRSDLAKVMTEEFARPGVVAFRLRSLAERDLELRTGYWTALEFCNRNRIPLFTGSTDNPELWGIVARSFPQLPVFVDQMALRWRVNSVGDWWSKFPELLKLAHHPNVGVKLTAVPAFSSTGFPFDDVKPRIRQLIDAFGSARLMWASDISRYQGQIGSSLTPPGMSGDYPGRHTYAESLHFFRHAPWIQDEDKANILGRTAERLIWRVV